MTTADDGDLVVQATRHDRRVTRVGPWRRQWSIDELPQLVNVIKGDAESPYLRATRSMSADMPLWPAPSWMTLSCSAICNEAKSPNARSRMARV